MTNPTLERVARAIEGAEVGYSISRIRLVDGVSTYALRIDGQPTREFPEYDDASQALHEFKAPLKARAALLALREVDEGTVEAMCRSVQGPDAAFLRSASPAIFTVAIDHILEQGS